MPRETVFTAETRLWHPVAGWQTFPPGERNPGAAWYERENGDVAQAQGPSAAALTALTEVTTRAEAAERKLAERQADVDRVAQERDDAAGQVQALTRRADEAQQALTDAVADKGRYAEERDRAIHNEAAVRRENDDLKAKLAKAEATVERLMGELTEAQKLAGDMSGRVQVLETDLANAKAAIAAFDGDGNGKPGGRKAKAADTEDGKL